MQWQLLILWTTVCCKQYLCSILVKRKDDVVRNSSWEHFILFLNHAHELNLFVLKTLSPSKMMSISISTLGSSWLLNSEPMSPLRNWVIWDHKCILGKHKWLATWVVSWSPLTAKHIPVPSRDRRRGRTRKRERRQVGWRGNSNCNYLAVVICDQGTIWHGRRGGPTARMG